MRITVNHKTYTVTNEHDLARFCVRFDLFADMLPLWAASWKQAA